MKIRIRPQNKVSHCQTEYFIHIYIYICINIGKGRETRLAFSILSMGKKKLKKLACKSYKS